MSGRDILTILVHCPLSSLVKPVPLFSILALQVSLLFPIFVGCIMYMSFLNIQETNAKKKWVGRLVGRATTDSSNGAQFYVHCFSACVWHRNLVRLHLQWHRIRTVQETHTVIRMATTTNDEAMFDGGRHRHRVTAITTLQSFLVTPVWWVDSNDEHPWCISTLWKIVLRRQAPSLFVAPSESVTQSIPLGCILCPSIYIYTQHPILYFITQTSHSVRSNAYVQMPDCDRKRRRDDSPRHSHYIRAILYSLSQQKKADVCCQGCFFLCLCVSISWFELLCELPFHCSQDCVSWIFRGARYGSLDPAAESMTRTQYPVVTQCFIDVKHQLEYPHQPSGVTFDMWSRHAGTHFGPGMLPPLHHQRWHVSCSRRLRNQDQVYAKNQTSSNEDRVGDYDSVIGI